MSFSLLRQIIDKLPDEITQITVSGFGETFVDKDAIEKIRYIRTMGYDVNILTNGTLLTFDIIDDIFELGVKNFRISTHTANEDIYNKLVGANNFETLMIMLEYASSKRNGITKLISTNVVEDINEVSKIRERFEPLVDILEIWKPHNWSDAFNYRQGEFVKKTCGRLDRGPLQVQVDGTVNACCFDYDGKLLLGDLKTQTLDEIFSSPAYNELKYRHDNGDYIGSVFPCKDCDQRIEYDGLIYSTIKGDRSHMFSSSYEDFKHN